MKNIKKILAGATAVATLMAMAACGSSNESGDASDSQNLTIAWWGNQDRNEKQDAVDKAFEAANEGVSIDGQPSEWSDYWQKLSTSAAGDSMPDVIAMDYSYFNEYVENGLIIPLDEYIEDGTIDTTNIDESILASGQKDGSQYLISSGSSSPAMIYNKTLLDEAGIEMPEEMDLDEFKALAKEVYEKTGVKTNFRYYEASELLEYVMRGEGKTLFEDEGLGVTAEDVEPYFDVYEEGISEGWHISPEVFAEITAGSVDQDPVVYGSDPSSMSWVSFKFTSQMPAMQALTDDDLALAPWPAADVTAANYIKPGQFWAISKSCENPQLAAEFINYYTNNEEAVTTMGTDRGLPVSSAMMTVLEEQLSADEQEIATFLNDVVTPNSSAINPPSPAAASTVNSQTLPEIEENILYGAITAKDAAATFVEEANAAY
ncbi:ABC transporter substrate-binding protein [Bifidobacterium eulemuris]|uniref:ABC transporter, extracellular substrate binding protein n=1 Tax=Bifidobacterium eulemuris TaxID=1765219 RepID=A0A261G7S6_9BIFI|nr:extracellular solute-binding protein [Bifidobacterium eulemuris]OZG67481.1 ABC transporter, extracellular substrate binding protein [Bifidobacterium eulemuris]QOL33038.1 extracellular solute-binding protein [Bifidobacterium eulemuris]